MPTTALFRSVTIDSDGTSGFVNGTDGNIVGTTGSPLEARLAPLANYGGPTPTHALNLTSPAVDKGSLSAGADQRGGRRAVDIGSIAPAAGGNNADIGAFELQARFVTNANDTGGGSLRAALTAANNNMGLDDILFDSAVFASPNVINLQNALPNITGSVNINGPGANLLTVRRNGFTDFGIFNILAPDLKVSNKK